MHTLKAQSLSKIIVTLAILTSLSIPTAICAQECEPEIIGALDTFQASSLAVRDDYAYLATPSGLQVVDISDPSDPKTVAWGISVGTLEGSGLTIWGNYAYATGLDAFTYFKVINISNPLEPELVGITQIGVLSGTGRNIHVAGSYCYIAQNTMGFRIMDITYPSTPKTVSSLSLPGYTYDVAVSGSYAYVANEFNGMRVVDISDPYEPFIVATIDTPDMAYAVSLSGSYAFVADDESGLQIIDISDPTAPTLVNSIDIPEAIDIEIDGPYAYVGSYKSLSIVDISDPLAAAIIDSVTMPYFTKSIRIADSRIYTLAPGLEIIDASDPAAPSLIPHPERIGSPNYVVLRGQYAYLDGRPYNHLEDKPMVYIADISDPTKPEIAGSVEFEPGEVGGVAVDDSYAYVCMNYDAGFVRRLHIIDVSDPTTPFIIGTTDDIPHSSSAMVYDLEVLGSFAYLTVNFDGLVVVDISNPFAPYMIGSCETPGGCATDVKLYGSHAFIGFYNCLSVPEPWGQSIQIIDVSIPSSPSVVGSIPTLHGQVYGMAVSGSYLFVGEAKDSDGSVWILDISDPTNPVKMGGVATSGFPWGIAASDSHVYFASIPNHSSLLHVMDGSNALNPRIVDSVGTPGICEKMTLDNPGRFLYMANDWAGLQIVDVAQAPRVSLNPTSLENSTYEGSNAPSQAFQVWNSCIDILSYSITDNVGWLYCTPDNGSSVSEHDTITVHYDTAGLDVGEYSAIITVAGHNASNGSLEIPVSLSVLPRPEISFDTVSLSNSCEFGGNAPNQTFEVWNSGGDSLFFLVGDDADWMYCTPTSSTSDGEPVTVTVHYSTYQLGVGEYSATISIIGPDASNSPQHVDVGLTVEPKSFTAINLILPADGSYHIYPSIFQWEPIGGGDNVFAVDFLIKPAASAAPKTGVLGMPSIYAPTASGIFWSTYNNRGIILRDNTWAIPHTLWDHIPSGSLLYWRVRGADLEAEQPALINSNEIRSLFKM